jgi:hypothetical protein
MTNYQKKIKHLRATMIHWGEENKIRTRKSGQNHELPERWADDFKWATKLEYRLSEGDYLFGSDGKLTRNEMKMCNELYKFYSKTSISSLLGYNIKM